MKATVSSLALLCLLASCEFGESKLSETEGTATLASPVTSQETTAISSRLLLTPSIRVDAAGGEIVVLGEEGSRRRIYDAAGNSILSPCSFVFEEEEVLRYTLVDDQTLELEKDGELFVLSRVGAPDVDPDDALYGTWRTRVEQGTTVRELQMELTKNFPKMIFEFACRSSY